VPQAEIAALSAALAEEGRAAIARFAAPLPPFTLAAQEAAIAGAFSADSLPGIVARLEAEGGDWARETLAKLHQMSPAALCWTLASLRAGASRDLDTCLAAELSLVRQIIRLSDFAEGVRAMVVDKDRSPRWQPARLEEVDPRMIAALMQPQG
jgi:enoyl-CoA hydratase